MQKSELKKTKDHIIRMERIFEPPSAVSFLSIFLNFFSLPLERQPNSLHFNFQCTKNLAEDVNLIDIFKSCTQDPAWNVDGSGHVSSPSSFLSPCHTHTHLGSRYRCARLHLKP